MVIYKRNVCTYIDIMATSWHCTHIKNQMTSEKCQKPRKRRGWIQTIDLQVMGQSHQHLLNTPAIIQIPISSTIHDQTPAVNQIQRRTNFTIFPVSRYQYQYILANPQNLLHPTRSRYNKINLLLLRVHTIPIQSVLPASCQL